MVEPTYLSDMKYAKFYYGKDLSMSQILHTFRMLRLACNFEMSPDSSKIVLGATYTLDPVESHRMNRIFG